MITKGSQHITNEEFIKVILQHHYQSLLEFSVRTT